MSDSLLILKRTNRHVIKKSRGLQVKYPFLLSDFNVITLSTFYRTVLNINHHDVLSGDSSAVPRIQSDGRKDGPNEANTDGSPYPQFTAD
jgi:hypothetical protein